MLVIRFIFYVFLSVLGVTGFLWFNIPLIFTFLCLLLFLFTKKIKLRLLVFILSIASIPLVINSADQQMEAWDRQIRAKGPSSLTIWDSLAIYVGNLWTAAGGFCIGAPEASVETLLLAIPNSSGMREANWVFFDDDPSILSAVRILAVEIEAKQAKRVEKKIQWPPGVYSLSNYRVSLALAGGSVILERDAKTEDIIAYIDVPITYPSNSYLTLIDNDYIEFSIPERMFWALEQKNWLHSYVMRYYFKITMNNGGIIIQGIS